MLAGCGSKNEDELILWWPSGKVNIEIIEEALVGHTLWNS